MAALGAAILSGIAFYLSFHLGSVWWLAWLAPVPVLNLAYGRSPRWRVLMAAFAAYAVGLADLLPVYKSAPPALALLLVSPLIFALMVVSTAFLRRRVGAVWSMVGFGALWAGLDYLHTFYPGGMPIALTQAGQVWAIQSAAYLGMPVLGFLIGTVSAGLAMGLRRGGWPALAVALILFAANLGLGMLILGGKLPRGPGATLQTLASDGFAWACAALAILLNLAAMQTGRRRPL